MSELAPSMKRECNPVPKHASECTLMAAQLQQRSSPDYCLFIFCARLLASPGRTSVAVRLNVKPATHEGNGGFTVLGALDVASYSLVRMVLVKALRNGEDPERHAWFVPGGALTDRYSHT